MFINDNHFDNRFDLLFEIVNETNQGMKSLVKINEVFGKEGKPLDNQDVSRMLHVSYRTLQRYRTSGLLPFYKLGQKIYYRASDVRDFVYRNGDHWDKKRFEDEMPVKDG